MDRTRRAVLAGAGTTLAAGLAGCGGGDDGDDGEASPETPTTEDTEDEPTETATPAVETIVDESFNLGEDNYESWQFYVPGEFSLEYEFTVTEGSAIDVYVVEHRQLRPFEAQQAFRPEVQSEDMTSDAVSTELPEGTYHVIVDHTSRGRAEPPGGLGQDPVDVEITATYQRLS